MYVWIHVKVFRLPSEDMMTYNATDEYYDLDPGTHFQNKPSWGFQVEVHVQNELHDKNLEHSDILRNASFISQILTGWSSKWTICKILFIQHVTVLSPALELSEKLKIKHVCKDTSLNLGLCKHICELRKCQSFWLALEFLIGAPYSAIKLSMMGWCALENT